MTSLPSLRALDRAQGARIWLAAEAADMRCGFDRLAEWVRAVIGQDPLGGHLFVFRSRRGDRLKLLVWDRDGFVRKRQTNGRLTGAIDSRYRRRAAAGARQECRFKKGIEGTVPGLV